MLNNMYQKSDDHLDVPDVALESMNEDQRFAFYLVMKSLLSYKQDEENFQPLRLIVAGTAGSGKSYLIKCLVKAIRTLFNSNRSVQVVCPTGNSANVISVIPSTVFLRSQQGIKEKK